MLRFTRQGLWEMLIGSLLLFAIAFGLAFIHWTLAIPFFLVWLWLLSFFRDPERTLPATQHTMVSPADGTVSDVIDLDHYDLLNSPCTRVGIFLSVFNVHVNRAPCDGLVTAVIYKKGKFINALSHGTASEQNESNTLVISDPSTGRPIAVVKQIVGLIARRIICTADVGDTLKRGDRIGMIKFGSRTELFIPKWLDPQIQVKPGQGIHGASDPIATLRNPLPSITPQPTPEEATP